MQVLGCGLNLLELVEAELYDSPRTSAELHERFAAMGVRHHHVSVDTAIQRGVELGQIRVVPLEYGNRVGYELTGNRGY